MRSHPERSVCVHVCVAFCVMSGSFRLKQLDRAAVYERGFGAWAETWLANSKTHTHTHTGTHMYCAHTHTHVSQFFLRTSWSISFSWTCLTYWTMQLISPYLFASLILSVPPWLLNLTFLFCLFFIYIHMQLRSSLVIVIYAPSNWNKIALFGGVKFFSTGAIFF